MRNMFFIRNLKEGIMGNTMYEIFKNYDLPLTTKARIKLAKTDRAVAMILFDDGFANLVGEHYKPKYSNQYFDAWERTNRAKINRKLQSAVGSSQKFNAASEYEDKMNKKIKANKEGLEEGQGIRRRNRLSNKTE